VVIDEAHRSVYQKYRSIFSWFDSLLVGLTATPKDEVDHNTYRLFHLEDGMPTYAYGLKDAVDEGFLVPAVGVSVGTKFLRQGIKYADLSEQEKDDWDVLEWGENGPPDEVSSEEINRFLFNENTVDQVLAEVMDKGHKVADGDRLAKTIIFAKNQRHAEFISQRFDIQYPEHAGHFASSHFPFEPVIEFLGRDPKVVHDQHPGFVHFQNIPGPNQLADGIPKVEDHLSAFSRAALKLLITWSQARLLCAGSLVK
jgi:type I site-specific restriction endonuclease